MAFSPFGCGESSGCNPCGDSDLGGGGGVTGPSGLSAYQVAVKFGGFVGTVEEWLASLVGPAGESAYQLAVDGGYVGTLGEWLASLQGVDGKSAYDVAVEQGFVGTEAEWLASLKGAQGATSVTGYRISGFAPSNIVSDEILIDHEVTQDFQIPANFDGSKASAGVSPGADWVASILVDDVEVGTLTIDAQGLVTWATTNGLPVDVTVGSIVTLVAPTNADGTIGRLRYTIEGIVA